ncbi:MAG: acyl-CoA dehydratase activase [Kiritimatiellia bacterium]|jgi:predicted CoA-substrate-specific enzyme activase
MNETLFAGIDAGSRAIKIALVNGAGDRVVAVGSCDQGIDQAPRAAALLTQILESQNLTRDTIAATIATGYGRHAITDADQAITEITCHATGVHFLHPNAQACIDIGGQDSKFIHLGAGGLVTDFAMNDRCAAGTGRFLEVVATRLGVPVGDLGDVAKGADKPAVISSMCVVFAESEMIGLLAAGERPANIVAGVCLSIAGRIAAMAGRIPEGEMIFTGGVARIAGMDAALATALQHPVSVASDPCMTGAIGAALLAARQFQ